MPALPLPDVEIGEPWKKVDFRTDPLKYAMYVKEYCWDGNVNNDFDINKNFVRIPTHIVRKRLKLTMVFFRV